jgi:MEMO1 family protein
MAAEKIRESTIAGSWYPGDAKSLRGQVKGFLSRASVPPVEGELIGLVAPHAGYMYSGPVAGHAYKLLETHRFDRVLVLAPSHRAQFSGASVYHQGGYRTPLGVVPLDRELVDALYKHTDVVRYVPRADDLEHSLEIQLPFLQVVLGDFLLTPVVMGSQELDFCRKLAGVIGEVCRGRKVLIVASSDLSHFHSDSEARRLDGTVLDRVAAFDPEGLADNLRKGECEACGGGPVVTLMLAAKERGADSAKVLHYANSGDVTGDRSGVVGYLAAAFLRTARAKSAGHGRKADARVDLGYSQEEKELLRSIALHAIRSRCFHEPMPDIPVASEKLKERRGAFVCLHKGGDLRGCMGMIEPRAPLHETIKNMAVEAAFGDPRFCALAPDELEDLDLEISVLTPLERMGNPERLEIGKHGLLIRKGPHSGLLLPQVATEHGLDRAGFLEWTCKKAGLPKNAWKDPKADIYIFSADIF